MCFTPAELAEMARADAEIDALFCISNEEIKYSRRLDRMAVLDRMSAKERKIAESQRQYREANKAKIAEGKRAIRELRTSLGISQQRFGEILGVTQATVSYWENISAPDNWNEIVRSVERSVMNGTS